MKALPVNRKGISVTTEIEALERDLQKAEAEIHDLIRAGKIPTPADYADIDRIKAKLKVARRVKAMDAKRTDPKLTRKISIMLPEEEFQALSKKAENNGVDLSKYIRDLLKKHG